MSTPRAGEFREADGELAAAVRRGDRAVVIRRALAGVAAATLLLVANMYWQWSALGGLSVDDAFITFRYADHWAHGLGPIYNATERVEGYSNFLWLCLLALCHRGMADVDRLAQWLGAFAAMLSTILAAWSAWRVYALRNPVALATVATIAATSGYVAAWAVSGLETALYGLLLLMLWTDLAWQRQPAGTRRVGTCLLCIAVALSRPEGQLVALAFVAAHGFALQRSTGGWRTRDALPLPLALLCALLIYHGWRFSYYGPHLLPNCVRAKVGFSLSQAWRGSKYVVANFLDPYGPLLLCTALSPRKLRCWPSWFGVALLLGYLLFIALAGGDWSKGRFFAPLIPLLAVLSVGALGKRLMRANSATIWIGLCGIVVYAAALTSYREWHFRTVFAPFDRERVLLGKWLARAAPADAVLAVTAAGQVPYYSRLRTHDMLGLNDAHIAEREVTSSGLGKTGHEKYDVMYSVDVIAPDIVVDAELIPGMTQSLAHSGRYAILPMPHEHVLVRKDLLPANDIRDFLREVWPHHDSPHSGNVR